MNKNCWTLVARWPGLRPESKLAWLLLFMLAEESKTDTVTITLEDVGASQGAADAERFGRRALVQLQELGLILLLAPPSGADWTVRLLDPATVPVAAAGAGTGRARRGVRA